MRSLCLAAAVALLVASGPVDAQSSYPDRTIRMLFGFAPGVDTVARILAERLGEALGKPVVVENVTGAGGNIAADRLAKAAPDGYTIGVLAAANVVVNGSLYKKLAYDPIKDWRRSRRSTDIPMSSWSTIRCRRGRSPNWWRSPARRPAA